MAALTTQNLVVAGTNPTFTAASTSDTAEVGNGTNTFVVYKNTDGSSKTVTITPPGLTDYGVAWTPVQVTIPATTGERWIPLRKAFDQADGTGRCILALSNATGVTVAVVRLG